MKAKPVKYTQGAVVGYAEEVFREKADGLQQNRSQAEDR